MAPTAGLAEENRHHHQDRQNDDDGVCDPGHEAVKGIFLHFGVHAAMFVFGHDFNPLDNVLRAD